MAVDIESLKILYFQNDEPCPYQLGCGYNINIYPIKVKDWGIYERSIGILQIEKNKINDIRVIQMSYLEFLYTLCNGEKGEDYEIPLANIIKYSLREDRASLIIHKEKPMLVLLDKQDKIKGYITHKEFDDIKKIILYQNIYDYNDIYVDDEVRQLYDDYYRIKYKDSKTPTLEEQKTYVLAKCGFDMQQINNMTYRMFSQVYNHCIGDILYIGKKIIQGSYKYQVDEDIKHPLYEIPKDKYAEIFEDTSVLADKGISGAEQLNALNLTQ